MRKVISVVLMAVMLLSMTACAGTSPMETTSAPAGDTQATVEETYPAISVYENGEGVKRAFRMFPYYWLTDEALLRFGGSGYSPV